MRTLSRLLTLLCGAAFAPLLRAEQPAITQENVFDFYTSFLRITHTPLVVSPTLLALCSGAPPPTESEIKKQLGPHSATRAHFYLNELAVQHTRKTEPFAPGAVIVKEKLGADHVLALAVGGMRKREPGYDPDNGDWEYFYAEAKGDLFIGKLTSCIHCHRQARTTDYVFARWPAPKQS